MGREIRLDPRLVGASLLVVSLLEDFPERAVIGTDCFYSMSPASFQAMARMGRDIVQALPGDLRALVGLENAERLYGIYAD